MGKNAELGLPAGDGMEKWAVAFDVDGTLIDEKFNPHEEIVAMLKTFSRFKNVKIVVWSGGGKGYAGHHVHRLGLEKYVDVFASKTEWEELRRVMENRVIAIDDIQDTRLGLANLIVRLK